MSQINLSKTSTLKTPAVNKLGLGFNLAGVPVKIDETGVSTPLISDYTPPIAVVYSNLGVGLSSAVPTEFSQGDIFVTSDTFEVLTALDSFSWQSVQLLAGQVVIYIGESPNRIYQFSSQELVEITGDAGNDTNAIHKSVAAEISTLTEKTVLVDNDIILAENSENLFTKIKIKLSSVKTYLESFFATLVQLAGRQMLHGTYSLPANPSFTGNVYTLPGSTPYTVYIGGVKYDISTDKTIDIGGLAEYIGYTFAQKQGQWFIWMYISGGVPVLGASKTGWSILDETKIPIDTAYANDEGGSVIGWIIGKEKHAAKRNLLMHQMEHDTDGARWVSGLNTLTVGSGVVNNSTNTFSLAGGIIRDEDLYHTISNPQTQCRIGYKNGATNAMKFDAAGTGYCILNAGVPRYDNAGTLTNLGNNDYGIIWQYATNRISTPIAHILGQGQYANVSAAQAAPQPTLYGITVAEWKLINRIIIRNSGGELQWKQTDPFYATTTGLAISGSGISSLPAGNIIFTPAGSISSTNVQSAIEETDLESRFEVIEVACSDLTTDNIAATNVASFHMPFTGTLVSVISSLFTVATGATHITDINLNGTTVLSTKLSIDASEYNSSTAATPAVISVSAFAIGDKITIDRDQVGATIAGAGHVVSLTFLRT